MTPLGLLGPDALEAVAALCHRSLADAPTAEELRGGLFAADQPAVVRGDPSVGVVATTRWEGRGYIRLVAVDPAHRHRSHGRALIEAAESDLSGCSSVTVGADAPYYLYPGVEVRETAMLCLLERLKYQRVDANFNMGVDLTKLANDPGGTRPAQAADRTEVAGWMDANWPHWKLEVLRALDNSCLVVCEDNKGLAGFCAYDVNRGGLLGPIATRLDLIGKGVGKALLLSALHRMRAGGRTWAEVAWVGPIVPYARVGASISRVFFVYRKDLA